MPHMLTNVMIDMFLTVHARSAIVKKMTRHAKKLDGRWIEYLLRKNDCTQRELCAKLLRYCRISQSGLSKIKAGHRDATHEQRRAIRKLAGSRMTIEQYEAGPPNGR